MKTINTIIEQDVQPGKQFVLPAEIDGIEAGMQLVADQGQRSQETVTVSEVSFRTFQADFKLPHRGGFTLQSAGETPGALAAPTATSHLGTVAPVKPPDTVDAILTDAAGHIQHFLDHNMPQIETHGYDFAGSFRLKMQDFLNRVNAIKNPAKIPNPTPSQVAPGTRITA